MSEIRPFDITVAEEVLVVGLTIQGREVDTVEAVKDGGVYYLPLEPLARATGCTLLRAGRDNTRWKLEALESGEMDTALPWPQGPTNCSAWNCRAIRPGGRNGATNVTGAG